MGGNPFVATKGPSASAPITGRDMLFSPRTLPAPVVGRRCARSNVRAPLPLPTTKSAGDLEATLNLGVGMVAVVGASGADAALRRLAALGLEAWALGTVGVDDGSTDAHVVRGTKGVHGGAVRMTGAYRT